MGYKLAGYRVVGNVEIDPRIAKVYEANLHPPRSYVMDMRKFNEVDDLPDELYNLDVLDGSPPCSTFSMAGSREKAWGVEKSFAEGQSVQRLDDLFFVYLETVAKLRPKVFIAENVPGMLVGNARGYVSEIVSKSRKIGYDVQLFELNSAFMGVPQARKRLFFIGNRCGYSKLSLEFHEQPIPFGDVRDESGVELTKTIKELSRYIRPYERDLREACRRQRGKVGSFRDYRVNYDELPAATIVATSDDVRYFDKMAMTDHDIVSCSTFPQDYDFLDSRVRFICGMSVPPVMMANISHEVRRQWLGE